MAKMELGSAEHRAAVRALEATADVPFADTSWRSELANLGDSVRIAALTMANDAETLSWLAARVPRSPGDERGGTAWTSFVSEVAVAQRISTRAAHAQIALAQSLTARHPVTLGLLRTGHVPAHRARHLVQECFPHSDAVVAKVERTLAEQLGVLPPWRLRQEITRIAQLIDAEAEDCREQQATAERTVTKRDLPHAQSEVVLTGPAAVVQAWWDALDAQARALKAAGDPRPLGALRFDLALSTDPTTASGEPTLLAAIAGRDEVVAGTVFDGRRSRPVQVIVTVPLATALGLNDEPAWLEGYGWISAAQARRLLPDAELREAHVAAGTGELLDLGSGRHRPADVHALRPLLENFGARGQGLGDVGRRSEPGYRPSDALSEFVRLRDHYCDGPTGAQVPARRADVDHDRPWPTGPTAAHNLRSRGRRTHALKHYGWRAEDTEAGTRWTSPAGQTIEVPAHRHPPEPPRRAAPDPAPPDERARE